MVMEQNRKDEQTERLALELRDLLENDFYRITISKPLTKQELTKVSIRKVQLRGQIKYQETRQVAAQVFHENYDLEEILKRVLSYIETGSLGQLEGESLQKSLWVLRNKKGTISIKVKRKQQREAAPEVNLEHNRKKQYLLPEGEPIDFLIALGLQSKEGRIYKEKYDKYRQINRYLEFVNDVLIALPKERCLRIVDFGCGKSYLTFALYYFLKIKNGYEVEILGLDLKKAVIADCNRLKERLGYTGLEFICGDIKEYEKYAKQDGPVEVDMVVTLHACDVATDYAIEKAVKWNASVILTVPCCQHELNKKLREKEVAGLGGALKYGLIKERMAALITDAYRALMLEKMGYEVQLLEFIAMEHTPKNILIRGVRTNKIRKKTAGETAAKQLEELEGWLKQELTLKSLLEDEGK